MSQAIMLFGLWLGGSDQSDVSVLVVPPSHSLCILRGCKQYRINLPLLQKFLRGVNCSHQAMQGPRQHNHPREQSLFCHQDVGVKERPAAPASCSEEAHICVVTLLLVRILRRTTVKLVKVTLI
ncbi:uncharacterized protein [Physcomitrium patens]|uniref:uncharacterized protein n=1 Tax=Physcomitrium patens TaxID=3218 RepID=UPI00024ABD48